MIETEPPRRTDGGMSLSALLDYFIPRDMLADAEQHRRARMFMLSHAAGPVLGNVLPVFMYATGVARDYRVFVFAGLITAFWAFPPLLRWTGRYTPLSYLSLQLLALCVGWSVYAFGGLASPFLAWLLILPLLTFLYLPAVGWTRDLSLAQITFNASAILGLIALVPVPPIALGSLQTIGLVSMVSVATYFAMMASYYAKLYREQGAFERELNALVSTSDNLRDLTFAAQQAGAAKADFIASMSHELRTPLNAIIGYSQLLAEEALDEADHQSATDLEHVHLAGLELLSLIDSILDYSRIDAGRMPVNRTTTSLVGQVGSWSREVVDRDGRYAIAATLAPASRGDGGGDASVTADWKAVRAIVANLAKGAAAAHGSGTLEVAASVEDGALVLRCADRPAAAAADGDAPGATRPLAIGSDAFVNDSDLTPTNYNEATIEFALAQRFVELLGGATRTVRDAGGPALVIRIPANGASSAAAPAPASAPAALAVAA